MNAVTTGDLQREADRREGRHASDYLATMFPPVLNMSPHDGDRYIILELLRREMETASKLVAAVRRIEAIEAKLAERQ